jgi:hypothetical protein
MYSALALVFYAQTNTYAAKNLEILSDLMPRNSKAEHSRAPSVDVKSVWRDTSTISYAVNEWCLIKERQRALI